MSSSNSTALNVRDKKGRTALYRAAQAGNVAKVARLLATRLDPNVKMRDFYQRTALHVANNVELVRLLIAYGADVEAKDFFAYDSVFFC